MLKEYENISQAHFKTNESIAAFFRYYLILMTVPIASLGAVWRFSSNPQSIGIPSQLALIGAFVFTIFACIGFCVMLYIIGQKLDSKLYSRVVNGVRNYFRVQAEKVGDPIEDYLVLPTCKKEPKFEASYGFLGLIISFALLDSMYLAGATWLFQISMFEVRYWNLSLVELAWIFVIFVLSMTIHMIAQSRFCKYKESKFNRL